MLIQSKTLPFINKFKLGVFSIIGGSVCLYNPLLNTAGLSFNVKLNSLKSENKIVTLPLDLHQFADSIRDDVRLTDKKKLEIKFFYTKHLDVITLGSLAQSSGARVGIPYNFTYVKEEDLDPKVINSLIGEEKFSANDWYNSENGQKLVKTFLLSPEARKFAIARGIISADSNNAIYIDLCSLVSTALAFAVYELLEKSACRLLGKVVGISLLSTVVACFFVPAYLVCKDIISQMETKAADSRTLKHPNDVYRNGATEYYEKLIERNKLLRCLTIDGTQRFNGDGDQISWFKTTISLNERLENCKKVIEEWKSQTPTITEPIML